MTNDKIRHDLKNQLAIILGFSEILLADTVPGGSRHADLEDPQGHRGPAGTARTSDS
jgi:hypothetical protein